LSGAAVIGTGYIPCAEWTGTCTSAFSGGNSSLAPLA